LVAPNYLANPTDAADAGVPINFSCVPPQHLRRGLG
jgi:hypothetical protein